MISAKEARLRVEAHNNKTFDKFYSNICELIERNSEKGESKASIRLPIEVKNSDEFLKKIKKELTEAPNLYTISFYENNDIMTISWCA